MLRETPRFAEIAATGADLTIIGAGPVGIITALAARDSGLRVLVLESGHKAEDALLQSHADDTITTPQTHHDGIHTTARRLGGAGHLWGGRCVPFDPIDFTARPWLPGCKEAWPLTPQDLDPWLAPAIRYLGAGDAVFEAPLPPDLARRVQGSGPDKELSGFTANRLERWTNDPRVERRFMEQITNDLDLHVALGVSVTGAEMADGKLTGLHVWTETENTTAALPVGEVILAAGGIASTRLLLALQAQASSLFGGPQGALGRHYMGHVNGQIADIVFDDAAFSESFDYHIDGHGSYVRRRMTPTDALQSQAQLSNVAFWPVVPEIAEATHRSGPLSAVFLGLSMPVLGKRLIAEAIRRKHIGSPPYRRAAHLRNILTDPAGTLSFVPKFIYQRYVSKNRAPGFFLRNPGRRYGLEFHAEHLPNPDSRITLDPNRRDRTGLPHASIDFRFTEADAAPILRAHDALEEWLETRGLGRLIYRYGQDTPARGIFAEAKHGNHQIGTIRMSHRREDGVVDTWGTCFDLSNLHVASTAVLRSSSQANPTLAAVQLALRLVDHLKQGRKFHG